VQVKVIITDAGGISLVTINGETTVSVDSVYIKTVKLSKGSNDLFIKAVDNSTKKNRDSLKVTLTYDPTAEDSTPPAIDVLNPVNNTTTNDSVIQVRAKIWDKNGISMVTINTESATSPDSIYTKEIKLIKGLNTFFVKAVDNSTNKNSDSARVMITYIPTYTVTYNDNGCTGGTVPVDLKKYKIGDSVKVMDSGTMVKSGCNFAGWNTAANGIGTNYAPGDTFTMATANVTLYANWTVTDIDGNVYHTIRIGTQTWMVENLKTTKYTDGTSIPLVTDNTAWGGLTTPGYCWYNNDEPTYKSTYGALYNWYTVNPANLKKIAPAGWHVATDAELTTLENYLIANGYNWDGTIVGNKIAKALAAKTIWNKSTVAGAIGNDMITNNKSGFSALPGSYRSQVGSFILLGILGCWWSSTEGDASYAYSRYLDCGKEILGRYCDLKGCGLSVRLLRDVDY
jgi:uncharacterized protein (TIGR02145 family)/uncharacterized repeat protein (TIGR02543 family)